MLSTAIAMFPSTYFYADFGILHEKTLNGNKQMRINSSMHIKTSHVILPQQIMTG